MMEPDDHRSQSPPRAALDSNTNSQGTPLLSATPFASIPHIPTSLTLINRSATPNSSSSKSRTGTTSTSSTLTVSSTSLPPSSSSQASISLPGTLGALTSTGVHTSSVTGLTILTDGKELPSVNKKMLSTCITPVPNITPIISITPVVSSPTISKSLPSCISRAKPVPLVIPNVKNRLQRLSSSMAVTASSSINVGSSANSLYNPCQVAPIALTTKSSTTAMCLVTNGKAHHGQSAAKAAASIEAKVQHGNSSESESRTGDSSDLSNESSDDIQEVVPKERATNDKIHLENKQTSCKDFLHNIDKPRLKHDEKISRLNAKSTSVEGNCTLGLPLGLSSSITLTPVIPPSPPMNLPLNLSLKPSVTNSVIDSEYEHGSTATSHTAASLPYKGAKRGPKPKHLKAAMADVADQLRLRQEELRAHLEAQLKQQQHQLQMARKGVGGQQNCHSTPPQIHIQTSMGRGQAVVITTTSPSSSLGVHHANARTQDSSRTIINLTKGCTGKSISLLAGCKSQELPSTSSDSAKYLSEQSQNVPVGTANSGKGGMCLAKKGTMHDDANTHVAGAGDISCKSSSDSKKIVAKFRTLEAESSDNETSEDDSSDNSGSSSDSDSSGDSEASTSDTDRSRDTTSSTSKGRKRDRSSESPPTRKRRKYIVSDERELRIPLEHGWRRLTKIRTYSFSGVRGEVVYFGPCGKKLKTYPEVVRYLEKNGISDITRENFTFSSKHNVGEFLEPIGNGEFVPIGEAEVIARIEEFRVSKGRRYVPASERSNSRKEHHAEKLRRREEANLQRQLEEQAAEARRQKEHLRFLKQQEKLERQEHQRIEREVKAQQILEIRKKRQEMLEKQRIEENMRKNKEREIKRLQAVVLREQELQKRREMLIMVDLERERRRQHMLLVKALEARKRQEERERMKEERITEKRLNKERKMEQRRLELQIIREMKKPVEDMELKEVAPLPTLSRIPGVKLAGKAFADILMVFEFLHNFGEALGFDMDSLPTLNTLQLALLNDDSCEEELLSVLHHLLICAIDDPGIPQNVKGATAVGQSLKEVDITGSTVSEILRIYIHANEGDKCKMLEWISQKPFLALNPTQKTTILAYLCNELLCSRTICRQIDNNIELVNSMRRDKWIAEGKVRKMKLLQAKKLAKQQSKAQIKEEKQVDKEQQEERPNEDGSEDIKVEKPKEINEDDEEIRNDSGNESEVSDNIGQGEGEQDIDEVEDEDPSETLEELGKKIDKFTKQQNLYRRKLIKATQQLRAISFGQDRYRRRYWLIPHAGGVFVEGLESTELPEDAAQYSKLAEAECKAKQEDHKKVEVESEVRPLPSRESNSATIGKVKVGENEDTNTPDSITPHDAVMNLMQKSDKMDKPSDLLEVPVESTMTNLNSPSKASMTVLSETKDESSVFNQRVCQSEKSPNLTSKDSSVSHSREFNGTVASANECENRPVTNFMKCETGPSQNGSYCSNIFMTVPQYHISAEQILRTFAERQSRKPWFSILPRMPCDETSLTRIHSATATSASTPQVPRISSSKQTSNMGSASVSLNSSTPKSASIMPSPLYFHNDPTLTMLQMGFINGLPPPSPFMGSPHFWRSPMGFDNSSLSSPYVPNGPISSGSSPALSSLMSPIELGRRSRYESVLEQLRKRQQQPPAEVQPIPLELQRGWWRLTDSNQLKALVQALHPRGIREKMLELKLQKYLELAAEACNKPTQDVVELEITDLDREVSQKLGGAPDPNRDLEWNAEVALRVDLSVLEQVENLEEKVASASMQVKNWRLPLKLTEDENARFYPSCMKPSQVPGIEKDASKEWYCPLTMARQRLLDLEENIERRYIKPPLGYSTGQVNIDTTTGTTNVGNNVSMASTVSKENDSDASNELPPSPLSEEVPEGLLRWRAAVQNSRTSSQLAVCLNFLESCIAWDRSIMKASCQFCNSGDNEAMLLLCDGCDKGYHTYCFKPKIENIPDGDWFCYECLNKATGDRVCLFCGKKGKGLCMCHNCSKAYHVECMEPPLARMPKGRWLCPHCSNKTSKGRGRNRKNKESRDGTSESEDSPKKNEKAPKVDRTKERNKNPTNKDMGICRVLLAELQTHEDAWPFLLPVNTKQFPSYRKVIKKPMDLTTIQNRLESGSYKNRSDFVVNVRLMFNNCETFNEDDSPVGKAGHNLRAFFEARWSDLKDK